MRRSFLLCLALLLCGCVSSDMMAVGPKTYPPRPDNFVIDVFSPTEAPIQVQKAISNLKPISELPINAAEIGRIDSRGAPDASWGAVIDDAKSKARELGGDAIVVKAWGSPAAFVGSFGEVQYSKAISMSVVRWSP